MENRDAYEKASKRVAAKMSFFVHLTVYVVVNLLLLVINLRSSPDHYWFYWPLFGWGIGLLFHGLSVFFFSRMDDFKERMIEKEMARMSSTRDRKEP